MYIDVLCFFPHFQWRHLPAAQDVFCFFRNFEQPLLKFQAQLDRHSAEPRPENRRQGSLLSIILKAFKLLDLLTRPPWSRSWRSATVPPDDRSWRSASSEKMWYFKSAQRFWWIDWWHLDLLIDTWLIDWLIDPGWGKSQPQANDSIFFNGMPKNYKTMRKFLSDLDHCFFKKDGAFSRDKPSQNKPRPCKIKMCLLKKENGLPTTTFQVLSCPSLPNTSWGSVF